MENAVEGEPDNADIPELPASALSIITTEHFALQGSRSATISESTGRASMFLSAVSGGLVALGLIATAARLGSAFYVVPMQAWDGQDDHRARNALPLSRNRGCLRGSCRRSRSFCFRTKAATSPRRWPARPMRPNHPPIADRRAATTACGIGRMPTYHQARVSANRWRRGSERSFRSGSAGFNDRHCRNHLKLQITAFVRRRRTMIAG